MRPPSHIIVGTGLSVIVYGWTRDPGAALAAGAVHVLMDVDHVFDHLLSSDRPFSPAAFFDWSNSIDWRRIFFFFHAYEWLGGLMLAALVTGYPWLWAMTLGVGTHLLMDEIGNRLPIRPAWIPVGFYFITYRAAMRFERRRLLFPKPGHAPSPAPAREVETAWNRH